LKYKEQRAITFRNTENRELLTFEISKAERDRIIEIKRAWNFIIEVICLFLSEINTTFLQSGEKLEDLQQRKKHTVS